MEERMENESLLTMSRWKLKQEALKNQRNYRQLENRLLILQLEKQGKIKSIQKKLEAHRKLMEIRMDRYKLKRSIQNHDKDIENQAGTNSRLFKDIRLNRAANIKSMSNQCRYTNHRLFREIKKQRQENEKLIRQESQRQLQLKTAKRNKVRQIEIQCKENVTKFWTNKMEDYQNKREEEVSKNLALEQKKMQSLLQLEKSEADLLAEIKRADEMETQLMLMMAEERNAVKSAIANNE